VCRSRKSGKSSGNDGDSKKMSQKHRGDKSEKKDRGSSKHSSKKSGKLNVSDMAVENEGLSSKQRRKVVSKAIISSSEGSDSEGEKKLRIDDGSVNFLS